MEEISNPYRKTHCETALANRLAELEAEIRARDEFLAIAAHEFRNPMTPIAAWVELLSNLSRREGSCIPPEILRGLERLQYLVDAYIRRATTLLMSPESAYKTSNSLTQRSISR